MHRAGIVTLCNEYDSGYKGRKERFPTGHSELRQDTDCQPHLKQEKPPPYGLLRFRTTFRPLLSRRFEKRKTIETNNLKEPKNGTFMSIQ